MISLRARLLVGYGYMMVLLLLTAGSAAFGFFSISEAIDRILSENFASVSASLEMLEALERQNAITMTALLEQEPDLQELFEADARFETALLSARQNVTLEGEAALLQQVEQDFARYVSIRNAILVADLEELPLELLTLQIFPTFVEVRQGASDLLNLNHAAILAADQEARETALQTAGWLGFLVTLALISMVWLARALQRDILARLTELTDVAESLLTGDHRRRFETHLNDELGLVCRQLNAALDTQDELQAEMRGRLNQQKQLVLGILEEISGALLLLGLDGRLIASSCPEFAEANLEPVREWLLANRATVLEDFRENREELEIQMDHVTPLRVRLLAAEGRRPVGWLIQVENAQPPEGSTGVDPDTETPSPDKTPSPPEEPTDEASPTPNEPPP
jgi:nitrogen fixation/metabolism regulation signal transduction histidine kinase